MGRGGEEEGKMSIGGGGGRWRRRMEKKGEHSLNEYYWQLSLYSTTTYLNENNVMTIHTKQ